jgi:IS5 family transposase
LSTKIHATCDALGNPTGLHLTPGQVCDLDGADVLLVEIPTDTVLAAKGYDADEQVIERLAAQGKTAVISPKRNRKTLCYSKSVNMPAHLVRLLLHYLKFGDVPVPARFIS